jgi:hypothetical protein
MYMLLEYSPTEKEREEREKEKREEMGGSERESV